MTKRKKINVKGIAKLDKSEMAASKGAAGCAAIFPDGQIIICQVAFHDTRLEELSVSMIFYL